MDRKHGSIAQRFRVQFTAMACENTIEVFANNVNNVNIAANGVNAPYADSADAAHRALNAAVAEVKRIEAKYSRYRDDSVVSIINRNAGIAATHIDAETAQLLDFADVCFRQSDGLFDITAGVLRRVWNFNLARVPDDAALATVLPLIDWSCVKRESGTRPSIFLPTIGMEIDFGGFGKEYAADRAAAVLLSHGFHNGFVELGGGTAYFQPLEAHLINVGVVHRF